MVFLRLTFLNWQTDKPIQESKGPAMWAYCVKWRYIRVNRLHVVLHCCVFLLFVLTGDVTN